MNILLVEDDLDMSRVLARTLERRGYTVTSCFDGMSALRLIKQETSDLIVLDLNIPQLDGLHILQRMRAQKINTPVLVLTARSAVGDRVAGLNSGADDYLAKPFDLEELDARIRALLRRNDKHGEAVDASCGQLVYARDADLFSSRGEAMELTPREHALLKALMARPGHAVKKTRLLQCIFPAEEEVQIEAVEVLVYRIRKKLVDTGVEIITLRGVGYLLRADRGGQ